MKGIELSKKLYLEEGAKIISSDFSDYADRIAVGVFGKGSECFGYDDDCSKDHDYKAGFSLFITREDEEIIGFKLMRAYNKLQKQFDLKYKAESLFGMDKFGVNIIEDYIEKIIGVKGVPNSWQQWFYIPEYALAEATNGEIFRDELGVLTDIRTSLTTDMPNDVKLKKLAGHLSLAAQTGQYNYPRMIIHGENVGCQLALSEFVNHILSILFSLDNKYLPYYKWRMRAFKDTCFNYLYDDIAFLLIKDNSKNNYNKKVEIIENLAKIITDKLNEKGYSLSCDSYLENQAISLTKNIKSREIKSLHIMDYGG